MGLTRTIIGSTATSRSVNHSTYERSVFGSVVEIHKCTHMHVPKMGDHIRPDVILIDEVTKTTTWDPVLQGRGHGQHVQRNVFHLSRMSINVLQSSGGAQNTSLRPTNNVNKQVCFVLFCFLFSFFFNLKKPPI
jgi:hypothetical protein